MKVTRYDSGEKNVWKYVFEFDDAIAEAVLYRYNDFMERTVLCISVQSGCPVGCTFCGTGKKFIRNLTTTEVINQVKYCLEDMSIGGYINDCKKFQIMFMSMGEPFLNYTSVEAAIVKLHGQYPNADLLVSTIAPQKREDLVKFFNMSQSISKIGLQFSIHEAYDSKRNLLIPYKNKYSIRKIRDIGIEWNRKTGRKVFVNYCINESGGNATYVELERLKDLYPPNIFSFTFSVICSKDESIKSAHDKNKKIMRNVKNSFLVDGYDVRLFNPAGQDDIGGGCGQLWHVQNWLKQN